MSQTLITSRDPKGLHAVSLFEAAYNKSKLDAVRAQRLNERGDELQDGIAKLIAELTISNQYANEEIRSDYTYPKEYLGPKLIVNQIMALANIFDLDPSQTLDFVEKLPALPDGAEGWFAIPSVNALATKHFPKVDPAWKYCQAVQFVHAKIAASRSFHNYREGQITPAHLRVRAHTKRAMNIITKTQKGDILIVAAQLGMRHRGRSNRRAWEVMPNTEFGLGSLAVSSIVLTHPERLVRWWELDMDCSGDEFSSAADGNFSNTPCLRFDIGMIEFDACFSGCASQLFGAVTGFLF